MNGHDVLADNDFLRLITGGVFVRLHALGYWAPPKRRIRVRRVFLGVKAMDHRRHLLLILIRIKALIERIDFQFVVLVCFVSRLLVCC